MKILVVGAGFAGAVYARVAAELDHDVHVIDCNPHLGGSAHDRLISGVRVHDCGPHLFHTSNRRVVSWLSRFTDWTPYVHKSSSLLAEGRLVPFPLNRDSFATLRALGYATRPASGPVPDAQGPDMSARQWLRAMLSDEVIDIFFARYVRKMWGLSLDDLPAAVVRRVQIRPDSEDRYFPKSRFQALPRNGYAALFANMLSHSRISHALGQPFAHSMRERFDMVLCSMSMDEFYDHAHGTLPYRSVRFHLRDRDSDRSQGCATINFTDESSFIRESFWHRITGAGGATFLSTLEEPCQPEDNDGKRFYPMRTAGGDEEVMLENYRNRAEAEKTRLKFIGRCGTFQYLNMDQVVAQSLQGAQRLFGALPATDAADLARYP